jgi:hypothetical protein
MPAAGCTSPSSAFERNIMKDVIRIGSGAAWWGDRIEPAILNAEKGDLDYLRFETMAEATVSAAQVRARRYPGFPGYDTYLDDRIKGVLPGCLRRGTRIIQTRAGSTRMPLPSGSSTGCARMALQAGR